MTGGKRPAEEPLSPVHSTKQARFSKTTLNGETASPSQPGLMEEWIGWGAHFVSLASKTARRVKRPLVRALQTLSSVAFPSSPFQFRKLWNPSLPWFRGNPEGQVVQHTGEGLPVEDRIVQDLVPHSPKRGCHDPPKSDLSHQSERLLEEQYRTDQEDTWPRTDIGVPPNSDVEMRLQQSVQLGPERASDPCLHALALETSHPPLSKCEGTEILPLASEQIDLLPQSSLLSGCTSSLTSHLNNSQPHLADCPPEFLVSYSPTAGLDAALAVPPRKTKLPIKRGKQRPYKNRPHILNNVHKAQVHAARVQLREELLKRLYEFKCGQGFSSDFQDFKGLLVYGQQVEQAVKGSPGIPSPTTLDSSTTVAPAPSQDGHFLASFIKTAFVTVNSPKPPRPFAPTLDQLQIKDRFKDEAVESRLHPSRPTLPSKLPPEDDTAVNNILKKRGIVAKFAREQVTDQDVYRLKPGQWLNDELINFYGAMILARSDGCKENPARNGQGKPLNVHYFSTFFWTKLAKEGYEKARLAKWTKKIDIFSKDVILIPVNHNNAHWTAGAINFRKKRIESYDSMGMAKEQVFKQLRAYLDAEHRNKKKKEFDFTGWENWAPDDTPQQENGYDCGVFTCQFLQALSQGEEYFIFTQKDMPYLRRRMIWEIGNAKLRDD